MPRHFGRSVSPCTPQTPHSMTTAAGCASTPWITAAAVVDFSKRDAPAPSPHLMKSGAPRSHVSLPPMRLSESLHGAVIISHHLLQIDGWLVLPQLAPRTCFSADV